MPINPYSLPERITVTWTGCAIWATRKGASAVVLWTESEGAPFPREDGPRVWLPPVGALGPFFTRDLLGDILYASGYAGIQVRAFYRLLARVRALYSNRLLVEALRPVLMDRTAVLTRFIPPNGRFAHYAPPRDPRVRDLPQVRVTFDLTQPEDPA